MNTLHQLLKKETCSITSRKVTQSKSVLLALLALCAAGSYANAQGYIYSFSGTVASELDGSYIVLSGDGNLREARILDSYGSGAVFDALMPPNSLAGFAVTSFGPDGFVGQITFEMFGYLGVPSLVVLSGNPAGISYSSNLFFPGNPAGGGIPGTWAAAVIPEPKSISLLICCAGAYYGSLWRRRNAASPNLFSVTISRFPVWKE